MPRYTVIVQIKTDIQGLDEDDAIESDLNAALDDMVQLRSYEIIHIEPHCQEDEDEGDCPTTDINPLYHF
jgi:hypothetical protein